MKKLSLLLVLLVLVSVQVGFAQPYSSAKYFEITNLEMRGKGALPLANGDLLAYGRQVTSGTPLSEAGDCFLIRVDKNTGFTVANSRRLNYPAEDIAAVSADNPSNVVIAVMYRDNPTANREHLLVAEFDPANNVVWSYEKDFLLEVKPSTPKISAYNIALVKDETPGNPTSYYITHPVNSKTFPGHVDCDVLKLDQNGSVLWDNQVEYNNTTADYYSLPTTICMNDIGTEILVGGVTHEPAIGVNDIPKPFFVAVENTGGILQSHTFITTNAVAMPSFSGIFNLDYTVPSVFVAFDKRNGVYAMAINELNTKIPYGTAAGIISLVSIDAALQPKPAGAYVFGGTFFTSASDFIWSDFHQDFLLHGYETPNINSTTAADVELIAEIGNSFIPNNLRVFYLTKDVLQHYPSKIHMDGVGNSYCGASSLFTWFGFPNQNFFRVTQNDVTLRNACYLLSSGLRDNSQPIVYNIEPAVFAPGNPFHNTNARMVFIDYVEEYCPSPGVAYRPSPSGVENATASTSFVIGNISIKIPADEAVASYRVLDMNGRMLRSGNSDELAQGKAALQALPAGMYLVNLITQKGASIAQKVVVGN